MQKTCIQFLLLIGLIFASQSYKFNLEPHKPIEPPLYTNPESSTEEHVPSDTPTPNQAYNITNHQFLGLSYLNNPNQLNYTFKSLCVKD